MSRVCCSLVSTVPHFTTTCFGPGSAPTKMPARTALSSGCLSSQHLPIGGLPHPAPLNNRKNHQREGEEDKMARNAGWEGDHFGLPQGLCSAHAKPSYKTATFMRRSWQGSPQMRTRPSCSPQHSRLCSAFPSHSTPSSHSLHIDQASVDPVFCHIPLLRPCPFLHSAALISIVVPHICLGSPGALSHPRCPQLGSLKPSLLPAPLKSDKRRLPQAPHRPHFTTQPTAMPSCCTLVPFSMAFHLPPLSPSPSPAKFHRSMGCPCLT